MFLISFTLDVTTSMPVSIRLLFIGTYAYNRTFALMVVYWKNKRIKMNKKIFQDHIEQLKIIKHGILKLIYIVLA